MARGEESSRERQLAGLRSGHASKADYAARMAWARRWRRTHWHVDWAGVCRREFGIARDSQPAERVDGMAGARAWKERHRGVDWDAVVEAEARG